MLGVIDAPVLDETYVGFGDESWILRKAQRMAISLKLGQDMHTADIAVTMGRSEGAVKLLVHRGLAAIRRHLDQRPGAAEEAG